MPSVFIKTYGCQMNERDSEAVAAQFVERGYVLSESEAAADVVLLNTCSVRDQAEQKAIGKMRHLASVARKKKREPLLGFLGCMAQSRGKSLLDDIPETSLVIGTQKFHRTVDHVEELLADRKKKIHDTEEEHGSESTIKEHLPPGMSTKRGAITGFVSIMQGCNQYCTFCIVPYTRGAERSRSIEEIVSECRHLAAAGAREVTLLGQIVTSYGKREIGMKEGKSAFVQLLAAVNEVEGIERIRFTSPHPKGYGEDLVEAYGWLPKLCESAHIPVQSGSDRLLKLMHRGYTRDRFFEIVDKLRKIRPGMGLTTDFIVGFPGETDADFEATLDLARRVEFDNAFVFKYSSRKDTPAASIEGQVATETREERHLRLLTLINEIAAKRYQRHEGEITQILVEGPSRRNPARLEGRTRCNKIVVFEGDERHIGHLMDVKIIRAGSFTLYGDPAIIAVE